VALDLRPDRALLLYLEQHPEPIAANSPNVPVLAPLAPFAAGASLLIPLVAQRHVVGLLALAEPRDGGAYSADDLDFLTTLADEAAAAALIARLRPVGLDLCHTVIAEGAGAAPWRRTRTTRPGPGRPPGAP
jgi:GAF domain-containing protein